MSKAGRPKSGSNRLPAWFDIEKYRSIKKFKADNRTISFHTHGMIKASISIDRGAHG